MDSPEEVSPDFYNFNSFLAQTATSSAPNNQFGDFICLDDLSNATDLFKDTHSFINHLPLSLPSLRGGDDFSKQVSESAAASATLSQGGLICSWTQSLPDLTTPVARKQKGRKVSLDKQRTSRQTIGVEDLQKHFGKKRAEAAKSLEVSVPTLKRISRLCGIARWPFNKSKNKAMSAKIVDESLLSPTCSSYVVIETVSSMQLESEISSPPKQLGTETDAEKEEKPMTVKVLYGDDYVKFEIFSASKTDLEDEISKRLKLMVGGFKIKYLDEEQDWISITCDADLQLCKRSVGMTTVKMLVLPSPT